MGGGSSRLNTAEGEVVPPKIRPLLIRRFEELRKHRNGTALQGEGTLSKKQLLKDAEEEDNNSQSYHETETEDKVPPKEIQPAKEEMVVRVITIEKLSRVVPLPNSECECESVKEEEKHPNKGNIEQDNQHEDQDQEKVIHVDEVAEAEVKTEEENTTEPVPETKPENEQEIDAKTDDDNDEDDDDDGSEEYGRLLCPGSPSFRIYCIEAERRKEEEESKNRTIAMHKKSPSADSVASTASRNSRKSNEVPQVVEIESTRKKKGNKMKKFGAVKTLLKVKSCYHPMGTCAGDDKSRILVAKATN